MNVVSCAARPAAGVLRAMDEELEHPLGDDAATDGRVEVSRRGLARLAIAAARTGARFEREGRGDEAIPWLLAPRRLFDGECAVDACIDLAPVRRCLAVHAPGSGLGLDADPDVVDGITGDVAPVISAAGDDGSRQRRRRAPRRVLPFSMSTAAGADRAGPKLYSCSLVRADLGARVMTFVAGVAPDEREFRRRLFERFGAMAALSPDVRLGFDQYDPMAVNLVSERLADWLATIAAEPGRFGEAGFDVVVEHRVLA